MRERAEKRAKKRNGNLPGGSERDWRFAAGCVAAVAAFGMVMGLFLSGVFQFSDRARSEGADTLREAIARASVQCYAIEGRYPPSVEYLEEQYGIQIDRQRYHVFYNGFASNIMPEITVIPAEGGEDGDR